MNIEFHPENFVKELTYMGLGMLAIIIVMGTIILVTMLLNRVTNSKTSSSVKKGICVGGIIAALALIAVLVFTDGSCALCRKKGEFHIGDKEYCKDHYEEVIKDAIEDLVD